VVLDIGTGDGAFVYRSAREDPRRFYIGVDATPSALRKVSAVAHRKPDKGGAPNALFVQAAVEALPNELDGVADEVHIHFPWGSLLRAVLTGDEQALQGLCRVCAPGAWLEVVWALDSERDAAELARLGVSSGLPDASVLERYEQGGFRVTERGQLDAPTWPHLKTSWAKRLQGGRQLSYLIARAAELG
jgi:16S rRNA (adenine(1408)-N(1))-methyltransferase